MSIFFASSYEKAVGKATLSRTLFPEGGFAEEREQPGNVTQAGTQDTGAEPLTKAGTKPGAVIPR